jgi:hypothetical protein
MVPFNSAAGGRGRRGVWGREAAMWRRGAGDVMGDQRHGRAVRGDQYHPRANAHEQWCAVVHAIGEAGR